MRSAWGRLRDDDTVSTVPGLSWREALVATALLWIVVLAAYNQGLLPGWRVANASITYTTEPTSLPPADADRDTNWYFDRSPFLEDQPQYALLVQSLLHGELPLWNPYVGLGIPWGSNFEATYFNPFNLFLIAGAVLGDFWHGLDAYYLAHLWLGGLGTYLFCRLLGVSRAGAALGAVIFSLNPQITIRNQMIDTSGAVWFPAGSAAAEYLVRRPGPRSVACLALVFAACTYSWVEEGVYCFIWTGLYLALRWAALLVGSPSQRVSGLLRLALPAAAAHALGLALLAASLGPFFEFGSHAASTSRHFFSLGKLVQPPELDYPNLLLPLGLAHLVSLPLGLIFPAPLWPFVERFVYPDLVFYPGLLAVPLVLVGLVAPARLTLGPRVIWPLRLWLLVVALSYSFLLVQHFISLRFDFDALHLVLGVAVFAAIGLDAIRQLPRPYAVRFGAAAVIGLAVASFAFARVVQIPPDSRFYAPYAMLAYGLTSSAVRAVLVVAFAALLLLIGRVNTAARWGAVAVVALELASLTPLASPPHIPFTPGAPRPLLDLAWQDGQPSRALGIGPVLEPNDDLALGFAEFRVHDEQYPPEYARIWDRVSDWQHALRPDIRVPHEPAPLISYHTVENGRPPAWDPLRLFGVRYVLAPRLVTSDREQGVAAQDLLQDATVQAEGGANQPKPRALQFTLNGERRSVLAVATTATVWRSLDVPDVPDTWLRLGYGLTPTTPAGRGVRFQVLARQGQTEKLLVDDAVISNDGEVPRWHDGFVDLAAYRGQAIQLGLRAVPATGGPGTQVQGGWSDLWLGTGPQPVVLTSPRFQLREVTDTLPRAYLATGARPLGDPDALLDSVPPDVLRGDTVLLDTPQQGLMPPGDTACPRERVQYQQASMNGMLLAYSSACPAYLVVNDLYYPGWHAYLDDERELPVFEANSAVRAVQVPAGRHRVRFQFEPTFALVCLAITGLAILVSLALLAWPSLRTRLGRRQF